MNNFRKSVPTVKDVVLACDEHPDLDFSFSNGRLRISTMMRE